MRELTEQEIAILELESECPSYRLDKAGRGKKDGRILKELDVPPVRYHQILNRLIDDPAALDAYPQLITELRKGRDSSMDKLDRLRKENPIRF